MRYIKIMLAALLACAAPLRAQGQLVIVGGGLADDNDAVFAAFLEALPAPDAPIAIIPAASGVPAQSASAFAAQLTRRGVAPERIRIIRLAVEDDPDTPEDESLWRGHGEDAGEIARLADVGAIWFTGGDQARILATLVRADKTDTTMLALIRRRLAAGAVIGGTSAGAAIMSDPMLVQGDPLSLVPGAGPDREPIETGQGLGFLRHALVDQHFGERARLIRLIAALQVRAADRRIGLGIDEDTALVVAPDQRTARVVGRGQVTVIDARATAYPAGPVWAARGSKLGMLGDGESLDLTRLQRSAQAAPKPAPLSTPAPCLSATSAAGLPASQSELITAISDALAAGGETTCLVSAGQAGLALKFSRAADASDPWLRLGVTPVTVRLEPAER